jgi:uncharacterized membrane protein YheB (UPF0754 family)
MEFNLIKEVFTGGITGYITNALAIKMIFREYGIGKFKVGGMVVKTRNEFIDNVSSLVENDIINFQTLKGQLEKESFKHSIKRFSNDLLKNKIYKNTFNLHLREIKGFNSTIDKTENYIKECAGESFSGIFEGICKNICLKDILNEKQAQNISENVFQSALDTLSQDDFVEKTIVDFYNENKSLSFQEFFGSKIIQSISENFEESVSNFHVDLKTNFSNSIDNAFEKTIETLNVHKILNTLQEKVSEKTIVDFVQSEDINNLSKSLIVKTKEFLQSNQGKNLTDNFSEELFNVLKSMDKPILDLLSEGAEENIEFFLKGKLQYGVKEIILWIERNKDDIESLVESAVNDTIDAIDDDMKKGTLNSLKDKFLNGAAKKFQVVSKITEYLANNVDIDSVSKEITLKIIKYLREEKLCNVVEMLKKSSVITEKSFSEFINFNNYLEHSLEAYVLEISGKKIKDICKLDLINIFEVHIKEPIISVIKNKYIYSENITKLVKGEVLKGLKNIDVSKFSQLLNEEIVCENSNSIKIALIEKLSNNRSYIVDLLSKELSTSIENINLHNSLSEKERKNLLSEVIDKALYKANNLINNCKDIEVKKVYDGINKIENIDEILTKNIELWLNENLEYIVKGNIKETISKNLSKLDDEELKVAVEEFMGKEMKPITVIGALLGAVAGIGMYFFDKSTAVYSASTTTIINIIVYGFVGWITNVQAITMLFRPYTEKRMLGIKIPFTPGVVAARKPKFAKSMSTFVDGSLLDKASMQSLFNKNEDIIYKKLEEKILVGDYKIVSDLLYKYSDSVNSKSYKYIKKLINGNKSKISNSLVNELSNFSPSSISFSGIENKIVKEMLEKIKESHKVISNRLKEFLKSEKKVSEVIPKPFKISIQNKLNNKIEEEIDNLLIYFNEEDKENKFLHPFSNEYKELVNKPVNEIVNPKYILKWNESFNELVRNKISSEETKDEIFNSIKTVVSKELSPDKKISELFNGFFVKILGDKFNYIMDSIIIYVLKELQNNEQNITEGAANTIQGSLNFFEKIGYSMLGGDEIVSDVVNNVVNKKIPGFIEAKKGELYQILASFTGDKVLSSTIGELNIGLESKEIFNIVNSKESLGVLENNVMKITNGMFNSLTEIEMKDYLKDISVNNIEDLADIFKEEIILIKKELGNNISVNKELLINEYGKLAYTVFENLILSKKVNTFMEGIHNEDAYDISKKFSDLVFNGKSVNQNLEGFIEVLINDKMKKKTVKELIDLKELNSSILYVIEGLIENEEIDKEMKEVTEYIIKDITKNNLNIIDNDTKKDIFNIIIKSSIDAAEDNFLNVISSIDFRGITEKQINNMNAKEIEDLFNSFAKKYFDRLKLYGFGGAFFGLHWIIGIVSFVLYGACGLKNKLKK